MYHPFFFQKHSTKYYLLLRAHLLTTEKTGVQCGRPMAAPTFSKGKPSLTNRLPVWWTVTADGLTEANLYFLSPRAKENANESLPAYHISRLTLIELGGNFLYSKQQRNAQTPYKNKTFIGNDYFKMCISLKWPLFSRVTNSSFRVTNRVLRVANTPLRVANRVCV